MTQTTRPTKESVREYMERRTLAEDPPPTPEDIRRQLGWDPRLRPGSDSPRPLQSLLPGQRRASPPAAFALAAFLFEVHMLSDDDISKALTIILLIGTAAGAALVLGLPWVWSLLRPLLHAAAV